VAGNKDGSAQCDWFHVNILVVVMENINALLQFYLLWASCIMCGNITLYKNDFYGNFVHAAKTAFRQHVTSYMCVYNPKVQ